MRREITRAREMRGKMSEAEVILWSRLRPLRARGFHFRRQAPFRGYFLDFICNTRRLVIEVDGGQHGESTQAEHDSVRDSVLRRQGYRTLRFWASDVRHDPDFVMDQIIVALELAHSTRSSLGRGA